MNKLWNDLTKKPEDGRYSHTKPYAAFLKTCTCCNNKLDISHFSLCKRNKISLVPRCKSCTSAYTKRRRESDPARIREKGRVNEQRRRDKEGCCFKLRKYNLTVPQYARMLFACGFECEICSREIGPSNCDIDHCHTTGKVRGLLCHMCNLALGSMQDSESRLLSAARYIRRVQGG